jgi:ribosomal-protein-alanine N-acetyltransferase
MDRTLTPTIRRMTMADVQVVLEIDRLSFPIPWSENTYRYEIQENRSSHMTVVEIPYHGKMRIIGYVGFWFIVDEAHISTIAVHPDFRELGMGELLLNCVLQEADELKARIITLEVRVSNQAAINLYKKYQFEVVGSRPRYYRDNNEDALLMTRTHAKHR